MRKSTLFISVALTAFILAILFSIVSAYQNVTGIDTQSAQVTEVAQVIAPTPIQIPTQMPLPTQPVMITPEQAADIASKVMSMTDLYSVELTQLEGVDTYLVTFSSGDLVYVGLDGQILSISKLPVTVVTLPNNGGGGNRTSANRGGDHESDEHESDEHENGEHESDDD